jgi:hypothetical protein
MHQKVHLHVGSVIAAIALGGTAGHVALVFGGTFTWIIFWLLSAVVCPLLICFCTSRHRLLNGVLGNLAMLGIPTLERLSLGRVWPLSTDPNPPGVSISEILALITLAAISTLLALAVVGAYESHKEG